MRCDCSRPATHRRAVEQVGASGQPRRVYLYLCPVHLAQEIAMNGDEGIEEIAIAPARTRPPGRAEQIAAFLRCVRPQTVASIARRLQMSAGGVRSTLLANPKLFERAGKRRGYRRSAGLSERWTVREESAE